MSLYGILTDKHMAHPFIWKREYPLFEIIGNLRKFQKEILKERTGKVIIGSVVILALPMTSG